MSASIVLGIIFIFQTAASLDIVSVFPSSIYAGAPAELRLQVDASAFIIPSITEAAIGANHMCARTTNGSLYCWGHGAFGQVGNFKNELVNSRPVLVLPSGVSSVTAGGNFACVLYANSSVLCFGRNSYGQLGDGTTLDRNRPVQVKGLETTAVAVSCGDFHACALISTGRVFCWGLNAHGQLGDDSLESQSLPKAVANLWNITAIALGSWHSCALSSRPDAVLYCWGYNKFGSVGNGANSDVKVPVKVPGMANVSTFALGGATTCASNSSGLYCWGWNAAGQVGDGSYENRAFPSAVHASGMGPVRALSIGDVHVCAIDTSQVLWCWGRFTQLTIAAISNTHTPSCFR
jgi:alpha-tubulin suppressor-like RCC1 family protein